MKICRACNKEINEKIERYTHVEDWNCEKVVGDSWWHIDCFKKAMNKELTTLGKQAKMMLDKVGTMYQNLPDEFKKSQVKEYVI